MFDWLSVTPTPIVAKALQAVAILMLAWMGVRLSRRWVDRFRHRVSGEMSDTVEMATQRTQTIAQIAHSVINAVVLVTAGLLLLNLVFPIGPLLAGVGVFGLALSFGAQSLVKDMISGFFILSENQFAMGDNVEIDGTAGVVEQMTLRIVMLRDVEGVLHIIPNGSISRVSNRTRGWARVVLDVSMAYDENVDRVIDVLRDIGREFAADEEWGRRLLAPPEVLGVQELGDSSVSIRLVADTKPGRQWELKREMRRRVKNRFDAEGIVIPFPQRTVHLKNAPATE